jgi:demethylmenaquinone methyltransferase/2-methoxy-6-polyprenyl-1,4-benzoquinol methylase
VHVLDNLRSRPDQVAALDRYRRLAPGYDSSCWALARPRRRALALLAPKAGEVVFDVGCGTGAMLPELARRVGPGGHVVGIEQSPEMIALARKRVASEGIGAVVTLLESSAEHAAPEARADALLFFYAHDVLQSPPALERLFGAAQAGARIVSAGARFLPWSWGAPLNAWTALRARRYLTTYAGLDHPWRYLVRYCPDFAVTGRNSLGTGYLGAGTFAGGEGPP